MNQQQQLSPERLAELEEAYFVRSDTAALHIAQLIEALRSAYVRVLELEAVERAAIIFYRAVFPDEDERPDGVPPVPLSVHVAGLDLNEALNYAKEQQSAQAASSPERLESD